MRWVTHFVRMPPEADGWIEIPFVTKDEGSGDFYWGLSELQNISEDELESRASSKEIEALPLPVVLREGQSVWLSSQGDVWVADEVDAMADRSRVLAKQGVCAPAAGISVQSILERIGARQDEPATDSDSVNIRPTLLGIDKSYVSGDSYNIFAKLVLGNMRETLGAEAVMLEADAIQWDNIPNEIINGSIDFCFDPFFLTGIRPWTSEVVQFGWIEEITSYVERRSALFDVVQSQSAKGLEIALHQCMGKALDFKFGIYGSTPSASEVQRRLRRLPGLIGRMTRFHDHRQMRHWISEDPGNRLIICDIGMAAMLDAVDQAELEEMGLDTPADFHKQKFLSDLPNLNFRLNRRAEAGFLYPIGDESWRTVLSEGVAAALRASAEEVVWDYHEHKESVAQDLKTVGVTAFSHADMCNKFLHPREAKAVILAQSECREQRKSRNLLMMPTTATRNSR